MYVAYCRNQLNDGIEESAMIFDTKAVALAWINGRANGYGMGITNFLLFHLGEQIPLTHSRKPVQQPAPPPKEQHVWEVSDAP